MKEKPQGKTRRQSGGSVQRLVRRQSLDEAHVSHDLRISAMGTGITVGQLKCMMAQLKVSDCARIKFSNGDGWALLESVSYCRSENEVSMW